MGFLNRMIRPMQQIKYKKTFFFSLFFVLFLSGCASTTRIYLTDNLPNHPNQVRDIMVYVGPPPIKSRPLALLAVARSGENSVWAVEILKMEAAEIGADALANLKLEYASGLFPELKVQALAVKYGK